jgi:hypothetical protein
MPSTCQPPAASDPAQGPRRPNWLLELEVRVEAGDLSAMLEWFTTAPPGAYNLRHLDRLLRRAIDQASRRPPRRFTGEVYRQALGFVTYVLLRLQACTVHALGQVDDRHASDFNRLPRDLAALLAPIERLSRLAGELGQAWASSSRLWVLAQRNQASATKAPRRRRGADQLQGLVEQDEEDEAARVRGDFGPVGPRGPL